MRADSTCLQILQTDRPIAAHVDFSRCRSRRMGSDLVEVLLGARQTFHVEAKVMESLFHAAVGIIVTRHDRQIGHPIGQVEVFRCRIAYCPFPGQIRPDKTLPAAPA